MSPGVLASLYSEHRLAIVRIIVKSVVEKKKWGDRWRCEDR